MKVKADLFEQLGDTEVALVVDSKGNKKTIGQINCNNGLCDFSSGDDEYELLKVIDLETMESVKSKYIVEATAQWLLGEGE